ncbi:CST complex subunit CTC1 [Gastrophryne carolinensis]
MEAEKPPGGAQVSGWLQAARLHVHSFLQEEEGGAGSPQLSDDVIRCLQTLCPQLPLSYSFTGVSQLLSLQRSPCVSLLGWDTERFHQWSLKAKEPPAVLSRARLLLLGYIEDSQTRGHPVHDGNLYLRDSSGCIPCEMEHVEVQLLGTLVLFPCWSYIPTQHGGGYVEVLSPPIPVKTPPPVRLEAPDQASAAAVTPHRAFQLLADKSRTRGFRVSVTGQLSSITSLVSIRGKTFFFFFLQDAKKSVPLIVQEPSKLCWYHSLRVGDTYEVTSLSISSLRGSVKKIFSVTSSSCLTAHPPLSPSCTPSPIKGSLEELTAPSAGSIEENSERSSFPQERFRERQHKESKTLTYQGVVTGVRDAQSGLYELDGAVLLCTAYTQLPNGGRGLREGARIEVCNAHLQQSPSPLFPTIALSCCLRSRLCISEFSRLSSPCFSYSIPGNVYLHLLFRYRLTLPEYLWVCDIITKLQEKLSPRLVRQRCLIRHLGSSSQSVAERLLYSTLTSMPNGRPERNLQEEMVADPHVCPLQEYSPLPPPWCLPQLSHLLSLVGHPKYLHKEESNRSLQWSHYCLQSGELSPPHVLLGVLHDSSSGVLQLKDQSSHLDCLILPSPPTAWIGCILEVRKYQLVMETLQHFYEAVFPLLWKCSMQDFSNTNRTYTVFLAQDVTVLHSPQSCSCCSVQKSDSPNPSKVPRLDNTWPQRRLLIESMEGRVITAGLRKGLQFQVKGSWLDVQKPDRRKQNGEPRSGPAREDDKAPTKVSLLFSSPLTRWFPFLQPNKEYQIIARGETSTESSWHAGSLSIEEVLTDSSASSLVSVTGVVSSRSICDAQSTRSVASRTHPPDSFLPPGVSIKVTLTQPGSPTSASVYLDLAMGPYPLGLLPGATVLMRGLERKMSRQGRVYLRSVTTTYICILSPPTESRVILPPPQFVLFSHLSGPQTPQRAVCLVTCVLSVTLCWDCSVCGSTFTQGSCERLPSCTSNSGVFRAKASVKAEDGSGEVKLFLQDEAVFLMLAVSRNLWEALQRRVLARGRLYVKNRGRGEMPCVEHDEDSLASHVIFLMTRSAVSRPVLLTFTVSGPQVSAPAEPTRFTRGDRDYITRLPSHPVLYCQQLQEVEPRTFCHMIRERNQSCDPRGNKHHLTADIANAFREYYENLYNLPQDSSTAHQNSIVAYIRESGLPQLNQEAINALDGEIMMDKFLRAIKSTKSGKAPEPDGFVLEYYKEFAESFSSLKNGQPPP